MGIIYILTVVILITSFVLTKKSKEKVNIIESIAFSMVLLFCYNAFICYVLTFFAILNKLWIISIINLIISALFLINIVRKKEIQKFELDKIDFIFGAILLLIIMGISFINFGFPFNVNYETSDPAHHYLNAVEFAENEILLPGIEDRDYIFGRYTNRKNLSYINSGLLMKVLNKNINPIECFNIFVGFGMLTLFLTGMIAYFTLKKFAKNIWQTILAMIVSLIFTLGYPLNSFLFGFEYLSMGILIVCAIIYVIDILNKSDLKYRNVLLFLLNFGLFNSYFMFVPIVYPAEWIYLCIKNYKEKKKLINKNLIFTLTITLLVPFILGYIYYMIPSVYEIIISKLFNIERAGDYSKYYSDKGLSVNGYIYINKYSNLILLIPLTIYYLIKEKKENKLFDGLLLIWTFLWLSVLYIGYSQGRVSIYYVSKNYFVLWIFLLYCNYKALIKIEEKINYLPKLLILMYIVLIIFELLFSKVRMNGNERDNIYENPFEVAQIFAANKNILQKQDIELNQEELKILEYARSNLDFGLHTEVVADPKQSIWSYVFLRYIYPDDEIKYSGQKGIYKKVIFNIENDIEDADYIIYFNKSSYFQYLKDKIFNNSETIFKNESGGIIRKLKQEVRKF